MPVTIDSALKRDIILSSALRALRSRLLPLGLFSTVFADQTLEGTDKVIVPYFPTDASTAKDFSYTGGSSGYQFGDAYNQDKREVTVNKRKYVPLSVTSAEIARQPLLALEKIGEAKGYALADQVIKDILSSVTADNYGAAAFTGPAANFDFAAVNESVGVACDEANWPDTTRGLATKSAYYRNVVTDLGDASKYASDNPVKRGMLEDVAGFDLTKSNAIPDNGENLVGFACFPSALLVAFAPIPPAKLDDIEYDTSVDVDTGLTLEFREWFDKDADMLKTVLEVNYGYAVGESEALKRIVSA